MHSRKPPLPETADLELAPTQALALIHFRAYHHKHRIAPSYANLAEMMATTPTTARQACKRLSVRGLLVKTEARYRPYLLTAKGSRVAAELERTQVERAA